MPRPVKARDRQPVSRLYRSHLIRHYTKTANSAKIIFIWQFSDSSLEWGLKGVVEIYIWWIFLLQFFTPFIFTPCFEWLWLICQEGFNHRASPSMNWENKILCVTWGRQEWNKARGKKKYKVRDLYSPPPLQPP